MDENVHKLLKRQAFSKVKAKRALNVAFERLVVLHDENVVHSGTDVKRKPRPVLEPSN